MLVVDVYEGIMIYGKLIVLLMLMIIKKAHTLQVTFKRLCASSSS